MDGVVRVRGAQDALVAVRLSKPQLSEPRNATGRAEEFRFCSDANCFRGLLEVAQEVGIGVEQDRAVREVVVGDLVSGGFDAGNDFGVAESAVANEEESCFGVVAFENLEDLWCEDRVRTVIEGQGNERTFGANSVGEV